MNSNPQTMYYKFALTYQIWKTERSLADRIMNYVAKMNLNYKLDKLTRGQGNCFPIAVLQQLSHHDIFDSLMPDMKTIVRNLDHKELRRRVKDFTLTSNDERLTPLRNNFDEAMNASANSGGPSETWQHYWEKMIKDKEWVDSFFVQATAFFLNLNIKIIETSGSETSPFHEIESGKPNSKTIHIGYVTDTHYQSLLIQNEEEVKGISLPNENLDKEDQVQCPVCQKWFKNALNHVEKSKNCNGQITEEAKIHLQKLSTEKKKKRDVIYRAKNKAKKRAEDPQKFKEDQRLWSEKCLAAKRAKDPQQLKIEQNKKQEKCRKIETEEDRLKEFRKATMFGAIFLCISCQTTQFFSNVQEFTEKTEEQLKEIWKPTTLQEIIYDLNLVTKVIIDEEPSGPIDESKFKRYICKTCLTKLKKKTLPATSVMNNLQLHDTDEDLKEENLMLTELEGSLIAKLIIFQKIFLLPRSRWTALKDRTINVPIQDETINNFVKQLPRLPNEAGLIGLELKRKKEMKNVHKKQLINPSKILKCLEKLKASGNPHYANIDIDSPEDFEKRCREKDDIGHDLIFGDDDDESLQIRDVATFLAHLLWSSDYDDDLEEMMNAINLL